ncbi:MAG: DUF1007 family protein, partial [Bauldia sp.]|nr:DUF1007 family protein [Bauldia sp.]
MIGFDRHRLLVAALIALFAAPGGVERAEAHPHVFVDAKAEIVFDAQGRITAVRNIWQFDEAFTSYATLNLDANNDGELSQEELEPLAKTNVESLQEFDFFTYLTIGEHEVTFVPPTEYFLQFHDQRLTLYYTLPLATPAAVEAPAKLEVFDPEYFVAFTFTPEEPAKLDGAPAGCTTEFQPPGELDAQTMAVLGQIPIDQRTIPDDLVQAASVLANVITIHCPKPVAAAPAPPPAPGPPRAKTPKGLGAFA